MESEGKKNILFDFNSFLIGIVMVLVSIIGFLTKAAYQDVKETMNAVQNTIAGIDKRVTTLETINSIRYERDVKK